MTGTPCFQHDSYRPDCSDCWHEEPVAWGVGDPLFCGECEKQTAVLTDNDLCASCSARLYPQPRLSIWDWIITALTGDSC